MKAFQPCQGKTACRDDGEKCLTCNRSLEEVYELRKLLDQLATLAVEYDYQNFDEYSDYIAAKLKKMIHYRREENAKIID